MAPARSVRRDGAADGGHPRAANETRWRTLSRQPMLELDGGARRDEIRLSSIAKPNSAGVRRA
jgi:hypothetical protein